MQISFDWRKDQRNIEQRGISLSFGSEVLSDVVSLFIDTRFDYGEERLIAYGYVGDRLYNCVYTDRDGVFHIISVRKANDREVAKYGRRS